MLKITAVVVLALLFSACGDGERSAGTDVSLLKTDQVIVAHRGASAYAPEHTFTSYDLALDMGTEYIEQDVLPTADGVLVCVHDDTLDRTARGPAQNCSGNVGDKTLAQLRTCDMGSWFNEAYPERARPEYVGLPIHTLEEVFQRYGTAVNYYIEIKPNTGLNANVEQLLLDLIQQYGLYDGMVERRQVLVQSFIPTSLFNMYALDPQVPLIQLSPGATGLTLPAIATYAFGVGPTLDETDRLLVDEAHALGLAVHPYTVNSVEDLEAMAGLCVDGAFTNYPDRYRALLGERDFSCPPPIR
jgi:glycerophosphoryl diester phosphodiesterase